jgi:ABC-type cobalamin/Fe3+-siderophores transport system ATPase subunit
MPDATQIVQIENVSKAFTITGRDPVKALRNVSAHIEKGEALVNVGLSGSDKSTLLRVLNGLKTVDTGRIVINGVHISAAKADRYRVVATYFPSFMKGLGVTFTVVRLGACGRAEPRNHRRLDEHVESISRGQTEAVLSVVPITWICARFRRRESDGSGHHHESYFSIPMSRMTRCQPARSSAPTSITAARTFRCAAARSVARW